MSKAERTGSLGQASRRHYNSPLRRQQVAEMRERILTAASELVQGFVRWDWRELTFRAVAEHAGVGPRTVYRHSPTERQLHDAVRRRLEVEAGIEYEQITVQTLKQVTARFFASLSRFSVAESEYTTDDPTFEVVDQRHRAALRHAVAEVARGWTDEQIDETAALLDGLWSLPTYERLVSQWKFDHHRAVGTIGWLIEQLLQSIEESPPQR